MSTQLLELQVEDGQIDLTRFSVGRANGGGCALQLTVSGGQRVAYVKLTAADAIKLAGHLASFGIEEAMWRMTRAAKDGE